MQKFEVDKRILVKKYLVHDEQEVIISNDKIKSLPSGNELRKVQRLE